MIITVGDACNSVRKSGESRHFGLCSRDMRVQYASWLVDLLLNFVLPLPMTSLVECKVVYPAK